MTFLRNDFLICKRIELPFSLLVLWNYQVLTGAVICDVYLSLPSDASVSVCLSVCLPLATPGLLYATPLHPSHTSLDAQEPRWWTHCHPNLDHSTKLLSAWNIFGFMGNPLLDNVETPSPAQPDPSAPRAEFILKCVCFLSLSIFCCHSLVVVPR